MERIIADGVPRNPDECLGWPHCKEALHPLDPAHWLHFEPLCRCQQAGRDDVTPVKDDTEN